MLYKLNHRLLSVLVSFLLLSACGIKTENPDIVLITTPTATSSLPVYMDGSQPIEMRVEDLIDRMTLEEKIGQMIQVTNKSIRPGDIKKYYIGSILSGGGGFPQNNTVAGWVDMVDGFQREALDTRLAIPLMYGIDAVHGHGNLYGATIFPHQIGLGATRNPELVYQVGQATALEMQATGIPWNFAPVVAVPQDIRWGRTYEAYSEDTALVTEMGLAYLQGLQAFPNDYVAALGQTMYVLATPKHYLGDGATSWGTSTTDNYFLDQGDTLFDESNVRANFLPPYQALVESGALSIMPSYSSWQGTKMHASAYWLTDVLKGELDFPGFLISDLNAINQIDENYYIAVVTSINAGVDMNMISSDYKGFISMMERALNNGDITEERVDDAVRRILSAKFALGLFEHPYADKNLADVVGSAQHRDLARQAVRESLVLLKNENNALPLAKDTPLIYVAGQGANDVGLQCGGWTISWQGGFGAIQPGTTILEGIQALVSDESVVEYNSGSNFDDIADVAIVVVGEIPYAEGKGDKADLSLSQKDVRLIETMRSHSETLIVVIISGRPLIITDQLQMADAWIVAWLPGTEGQGIADVLFGDYPFTGKLPYSWPRTMEQLPINVNNLVDKTGCDAPLFPFGYGLSYGETMPEHLECK